MNQPQVIWNYKKALKDAKVTQTELAELTGIKPVYLSMFGNGRYLLTDIELRKIGKALRIPRSMLFPQESQGE